MTSKLQVTIPKAIADRYGIAPGADVEWLPAGDAIRVVPKLPGAGRQDPARRLAIFDAATDRQRDREEAARTHAPPSGRGWTREELYARGGAD